jgi:uncharacterized membrane protein YeaQ/YmgE (transglycosylase-associated protein family)
MYLIRRIITGLIGCGLGLLLVNAAGWGEMRWLATGVPIFSGVGAMALLDVWKARRAKS